MEEWRSLKSALARLGGDELRGLIIFLISGAAIIIVAYIVGRLLSGT